MSTSAGIFSIFVLTPQGFKQKKSILEENILFSASKILAIPFKKNLEQPYKELLGNEKSPQTEETFITILFLKIKFGSRNFVIKIGATELIFSNF